MASSSMPLPPGAKLVTNAQTPTDAPALPPGAKLMSGAPPAQSGPVVSPGASDDQIMRSFGYDPAVIAKSPFYQKLKANGGKIADIVTDPNRQDWRMKLANSPLGDLGQGAMDILQGTAQLSQHLFSKIGLANEADNPFWDLITKVQQEDYRQNIRHGNPNTAVRTVGNLVAGAALPGPEAGAGASLLERAATGAANGAIAGATQPVIDKGSGGNYVASKVGQVGIGAATGAALAGVTGVAAKAINAVRGKLPQQAADLIAAGKEHNVRMTYGDVSGSVPAQKAEVAMESVPIVGTSGTRAAQQAEARTAAEDVQRKLYDKFLDTDPEAFDDVTKAAAGGDQRARNLIDKLQNAGNDPDKVSQASIGLGDFRTRQTATELYDRVQDLVQKNNLGDVPLPATARAINDTIAELGEAKLPNKELLPILQTIRKNISPKPAPAQPVPTNIRDFVAQKAANQQAEQANNSYGAIRNLVSDMGDRIRGYYEGNHALIGEKGVGYLERVRNAVQDDLSSFTRTSNVPEIQVAGQVADDYYKTARVPYRDGMLAQAAVTTEPDQIFQQFIKAGKGDRAQKFYTALDAKGQAAVRYQMAASAVNDATSSQGGNVVFSPAKFYNSMDKLSDAYGVFFRGADRQQMDGFKNVMAHVTRAGQFAENPPTGNRAITAAMGAGAAINPLAAAKVAGVTGILKTLMTTPAGRNFLLAAGTLKPGTAAMENLMDRMSARLASSGAVRDSSAMQPSPTTPSEPGSAQPQQ